MSWEPNTILIERANELLDEVVGSPYEGELELALKLNNLDRVYELVREIERHLYLVERQNDEYPETH